MSAAKETKTNDTKMAIREDTQDNAQKGGLKEYVANEHNREDHECTTCGKVLASKGSLRGHMKIHETVRRMNKCQVCMKLYTSSSSLKRHIDSAHNQKRHVCTTCDKIYRSKSNLHTHMKVHKTVRHMYKCHVCMKLYTTSASLKQHIDSAHNQKKHVCTSCGKMYTHKSYLKKHMTIHETLRGMYKCQVCMKLYTSSANLKHHIDSVHNLKRLVCTTCDKIYRSKSNLYEHMKVHKTERDKYTCEHCGKCMVNKRDIEHHIRTQHNRQHFCVQCRQYFETLHEFNTHKAVHLGEGYRCQHCTNLYKTKERLKKHMMFHFPSDRVRCTLCTRSSVNNIALRAHMIDYHGVRGEDYKCDVCKKHYNTRKVIKVHMGVHFKRYKCRVCYKLYGYKSVLAKHMKTVHMMGPRVTAQYYCEECTGTFASRNNIYQHWLKYHNPGYRYKCLLCNYRSATAQGLAGHNCKRKYKRHT